MNGRKYFIISDQMPPRIAHHVAEILNRQNIFFEHQPSEEWSVNPGDVLFTCSTDFVQKIINDLAVVKVFLIFDQSHELICESVYVVPVQQLDSLASVVELIKKNDFQENMNNVLEAIFSNYQKVLTKVLVYLENTNHQLVQNIQSQSDDMIDLLNIFNVFLEFENKLFGIFDTTDYFNLLNSEIKKHGLYEKLEFLSLPKLVELYPVIDFEQNAVYPLNPPANSFVWIKYHKKKEEAYQEIWEIFFIKMINEFITRQLNKEETEKNNDILEKTFSLIPYPLALFGQNKELILYNQKFLQMNILPSVCTHF